MIATNDPPKEFHAHIVDVPVHPSEAPILSRLFTDVEKAVGLWLKEQSKAGPNV
jgi:hypothetical protein